jgi:hypothetical protein
MKNQDLIISSISKLKKQYRRNYTKEQDNFISECAQFINIDNKKRKWKQIEIFFKARFPNIQPERTSKEHQKNF